MNRGVRTILYVLPLPVIAGALFAGSSSVVSAADVWRALTEPSAPLTDAARTVLFDVRLPRILLAFITGAILSSSGAAMQAVFRNPLVDPYVLGLSSGAAFGAALAAATGFSPMLLPAFLFGAGATALSAAAASKRGRISVVSLILAGIVVNGIFTAALTVVQYMSDPFTLQTIVQWTMGGFQTAGWEKTALAAGPAAAGAGVLLLYRWRLNVLAMGDDEARSSGLHPVREKLIILSAAGLACAAGVAVAGIIGFYGLIVPHLLRMTAGPDHRRLVPLSMTAGGSFLVLIDTLSRTLMPYELPIGVFTMLLGAPLFLLLIRRNDAGWDR
ncbi:MAG: iron ABC transporter permease [Bacteroidetes bacterium]|nr:MAG: iron ABC transporter permease [Bacteroidota bacterium]